jgi:hypothetical protein
LGYQKEGEANRRVVQEARQEKDGAGAKITGGEMMDWFRDIAGKKIVSGGMCAGSFELHFDDGGTVVFTARPTIRLTDGKIAIDAYIDTWVK